MSDRSQQQQLVSVVLPAYNAAAHISRAIDSILAQQKYVLEVLVVDDGSTDQTAAIACSYGGLVQYVRQDNQGPAAARNAGIKAARSERICFIDADDIWPAERLARDIQYLAANPSAQVVLGKVRCFRDDEEPVQHAAFSEPFICYLLGAALIRVSAFDAIGLFDETLRQGEDLDWFLRAREANLKIALLDDVSLFYRRHEGNLSRDVTNSNEVMVRMIKQSLDRRRSSSQTAARSLGVLNA